ncbi:MAG TPA: PAS domain S-box protein, partial [Aquella sp.]|nr:PAS domain S-box protein [Aquella sp.]
GLNTLSMEGVGALKKEDVIGKNAYEQYKDKDVANWLQQAIDGVLRTGIPSKTEDRNIDMTGKVRYFLSTRSALRNKKNEIIGMIGTSIEITAEKEAEQLKLENIKLESQNKLNQIFLEKLAAETEAEHLRLENEAYLAQKKEQAKFLAFIDKIQRDIQNYKIEALTEQIGVKPNISNSDKQIRLTKRELDVLYYLSLNKSPKEIAQIITAIENKQVSDSTINAIINKKLYPKFKVFNISQLVEKAIMLNLIPLLLT